MTLPSGGVPALWSARRDLRYVASEDLQGEQLQPSWYAARVPCVVTRPSILWGSGAERISLQPNDQGAAEGWRALSRSGVRRRQMARNGSTTGRRLIDVPLAASAPPIHEPQTPAECLALIQQLYRALPPELNSTNTRRGPVEAWAEIRRLVDRYNRLRVAASL